MVGLQEVWVSCEDITGSDEAGDGAWEMREGGHAV